MTAVIAHQIAALAAIIAAGALALVIIAVIFTALGE